MFRRRQKFDGSSILEYMALIVFILAVMLVMEKYVGRGLAGRWKAMGDTFGQGRQYDPRSFGVQGEGNGTLECIFDYTHCEPGTGTLLDPDPCVPINAWINKVCYDEKCKCGLPQDSDGYLDKCQKCVKNCRTTKCN